MHSIARFFLFSFVSFLISFMLFPVVIKIFKKLQWFDLPGTHKIHSEVVPSMGGIPVMAGASLALLMSLPLQQWISMKYFFISILLMFLIGLRDDVLALSPRQKLFSQFLPVFVLVFMDNVMLYSFYGFIEAFHFPLAMAYGVSLFTVVIITNAYNLIDGIDGLAGALGFLALCFFGSWFYAADQSFLSLIAFCFAGALLAFLLFNWQPSSIFMGDTGALTIGLVLSYLTIHFINSNFQLPEGHVARFSASISTAICVLIIPIFDTFRVILVRLRHLQSPFHADHNHIHHQFLRMGHSHAMSVRWIGGINIAFMVLAVLLRNQPDIILLPLIVILCLVLNFVLTRKRSSFDSVENA